MSIDPKTLPDGTVVEIDDGECVELRYAKSGGTTVDRDAADRPFPLGVRTILRTFSPDPTPDQEVPREEWANIKPGSRVRIVATDGDEHTVTVVTTPDPATYIDSQRYGYYMDRIARVYLLSEPADPDADLIEAMAIRAWDIGRGEKGNPIAFHELATRVREVRLAEARAALAVVREHEAEP